MNYRETVRNMIISNQNSLIDIHTHCGHDHFNVINKRYPSSQSVIDLESKTSLAGIDFVVSFPVPGELYYFDIYESSKGKFHEPKPIEPFPYYFANRQLLYEISLFGNNRILPFANIYPHHEEQKQIAYLEELAKGGQIFGFKLHTLATQYSAEDLTESQFIKLAGSYSLPIIIHSGHDKLSDPMNILKLATRHPNIRFCIAHAARFEKRVFDHLNNGKIKNVFVDSAPFLSLCKLTQLDIISKAGNEKLNLPYSNPNKALVEFYNLIPERIVWGTDEPWTTITDDRKKETLIKATYKDEVDLLKSTPIALARKIAHDNSVRFLFGDRVS